jgi:hypothetical protein
MFEHKKSGSSRVNILGLLKKSANKQGSMA